MVWTKKICLAPLGRFFEALSNGHRFLYDCIMISQEKVKINRSILFPSFFAYFLLFVEVNVFTLLALKSKRIELLSSAWRHFEDFFKLFSMVTDFNRGFQVVSSQISPIGETIFLTKMVHSFLRIVLLDRIRDPKLY